MDSRSQPGPKARYIHCRWCEPPDLESENDQAQRADTPQVHVPAFQALTWCCNIPPGLGSPGNGFADPSGLQDSGLFLDEVFFVFERVLGEHRHDVLIAGVIFVIEFIEGFVFVA